MPDGLSLFPGHGWWGDGEDELGNSGFLLVRSFACKVICMLMRLCDPETSASPLFASLSFSVCTERKESESASHSVVSRSLRPRGLYSPWDSPTQNTGVGSLCLLQGIFPTQGSNHKGSPRILEWVAYPFSSGSSRPRNRTGVSCITGTFFTN